MCSNKGGIVMYNRLDNLGDYAVVGRDLKMFDGNREDLYNSIKKACI